MAAFLERDTASLSHASGSINISLRWWIMRRMFLWIGSLCSLFLCHLPGLQAGDWAHWRGPEQTGVSRETNLPDKFSTNPGAPDNNLIWRKSYGGRSAPLIMNGRVFLINDAGEGLLEQERIMAFDAKSGDVL